MKLKILIILLILSIIGAIVGFWQFQRLRGENLSLKKTIEELETKKKVLEMRLKDKEEKIAKLIFEMEEKTQLINSLEDQIKDEKAKYQEITLLLKDREEEIAKERRRSLELEDKLNRREIEFKFLLARVKDLEQKKEDLEKKVLEGSVKLGKIEVKERKEDIQVPISSEKKLEGNILVVNRDYDFAVINLGELDGLNISDTLSVWRENEHLGDVKVEELRDRISVVAFLDKEMKDRIKEGDHLIFSSP